MGFGQLQHAADHHPLAAVEDHLVVALLEQVGDFLADLVGLQALAAEQAQHRMGGTRAQRAVALQALLAALAGDLVEHLDEDREADGRVQVAFRDMEAQALGGQAEADHHQEAQAQHDHRRVTIDEVGQRLAGDDHQADGDDHRDHHHFQVLDHAHRGDHRVEREHRVEHHDLRDDRPEQRVGLVAGVLGDMAFEAFVQLHGGLEQQEHATEQHDQVAAGEALAEYLEQRLGEGHHPRDARQQAQAHQQRQRQAEDPGAVAQVRRQLVGEDRDEHQVVDAEDDLQHDQGRQAEPGSRVSYPFHVRLPPGPAGRRAGATLHGAAAAAGGDGGDEARDSASRGGRRWRRRSGEGCPEGRLGLRKGGHDGH